MESVATAQAQRRGDVLEVMIGGDWRVVSAIPPWKSVQAEANGAKSIQFKCEQLGSWDSSLALFINDATRWAKEQGATVDVSTLPEGLRKFLERTSNPAKPEGADAPQCIPNLFTAVGVFTTGLVGQFRDISHFVGECTLSAGKLIKQPHKFRLMDCIEEMQQCGAMALPIVGLISFLVGLTLAFQAAVQLRQFGADIFVADLVGLSVVREMGPMMAAVVLAGRTGAAFAATLGTMKVGEEIDALETFGIAPMDFLVVPRVVALLVMMPLMALYANALGILGGLVVSSSLLNIPPSAYWIETQTVLDLSDLSSGMIKSVCFGLLIGLAGCLRGFQCDRTAAGIGRAATSAVVTGILLIIVSDSIFSVIFNAIGL